MEREIPQSEKEDYIGEGAEKARVDGIPSTRGRGGFTQ